ncbi:MAG: lactonase family protein [Xanthomonadales bacterium]|nr:lactonase family protein [Xanthomonadales bacterium]
MKLAVWNCQAMNRHQRNNKYSACLITLLLWFALFSAQSWAQGTTLSLVEDVDFGVEDDFITHWVVSPDNRFLFAYGEQEARINVFERDLNSGRLSPQSSIGIDVMPINGLANLLLSGDGRFLYAAGFADDHVQRFSVDPNTGALSLDDEFAMLTDPISEMVLVNDILYVVTLLNPSNSLGHLLVFSINPSDGVLTMVQGLARLDTATDLFVAPGGSHFYILEPDPLGILGANRVLLYDITADGSISNERVIADLQITANFTAGAGFSSDGRQLFLTAEGPGSPPPTLLTQLQRDPATGHLSLGTTIPLAAALLTINADALTVLDNDRTLLTVGAQGPSLYAIDSDTGALTALPPVANANTASRSVAMDRSGGFLYEAHADGVRVYRVNGNQSNPLPVPSLNVWGVLLLVLILLILGAVAYVTKNPHTLR